MGRKIIYQFFAGILGALVLGIFLGYVMLIYGANYGCFFWEGGYETCGPLGLLIGVIVGAVLGVILSRLNWRKHLNLDKK